MKKKILIIEPEEDIGYSLQQLFTMEGYYAELETDLNTLKSGRSFANYDLIVADTDLDCSLNSVIAEKRKIGEIDTKLFVIGCYCVKYRTQACIRKGIDGMISKPMDMDEMVQEVRKII